ncbi:uncharacterized protein BP01DRAFT_384426 [Aspergillus saccharolyticus JOP 1030-1]|uniref:CBM-cenC domain-containing protein n=1 Tax=Aspergillus saccharolyticus JOP 1030-1 TaxID=1450539 RepID=A0A319A8T9_9EURO|nr:hypothetical protein BP01DRAFT_384426 [Aspergillus saccharolyticus JOP 1030-1]PYH43492.1 hypothetical protein BP01DRAFT_384426 [Aspergillus saccharolyticus JOP 1030-1]
MRSLYSLSAALFLVSRAAAETKVVTGTTESCTWTDNVFLNPSFDSGAIAPWAVYDNYGTATVVADDANDGGYVAVLVPDTSSDAVIYQTLTDLVVGDTYTLSFDYKIQSSTRSGTCNAYFAVDGIDALNHITLTASGYIQYSTTATDWQTLSTTYVPTSSSLTMYIQITCSSYVRGVAAQPTIYLDNTQCSNPNKEIETCTDVPYTSTLTILPTPTSTPVVTSAQVVTPSVSAVSVSPAASSTAIVSAAASSFQPSAVSSAAVQPPSSAASPVLSTSSTPSSHVVPSSSASNRASSIPLIPSSPVASASSGPHLPSSSNLPASSPPVPVSPIRSSSGVAAASSPASLVPGSSSVIHSATPSSSAAASPSSLLEDVVTVTRTVYTTELIIETNCPTLVY